MQSNIVVPVLGLSWYVSLLLEMKLINCSLVYMRLNVKREREIGQVTAPALKLRRMFDPSDGQDIFVTK